MVYLFTFQKHDGDLVKYFDLVLTIPIHGYPYIYYRNQYNILIAVINIWITARCQMFIAMAIYVHILPWL